MTKNDSASTLIFVYGTLMRGDVRSSFLSKGQFVSEAVTAPKYCMYNLGSYPGLVPSQTEGLSVEGEIYSVDPATLEILDEVEGVAEGLYIRDVIELTQPELDRPVQTYFYRGEITGLPDCGPRWNTEWSR